MVKIFEQEPPDSSRIIGRRQMDRTWGNTDNFVPLNPPKPPMPEHMQVLSRPKIPAPSIIPSDVIQTNQNNVPFSEFVHNLNHSNFPEDFSKSKNKPPVPVLISIYEKRESLLSILSNQFYGKISSNIDVNKKYDIVFSPYSLYYSLLALLVGAKNDTFTELGNAMGIIKPDILPGLVAESIKLHRELMDHQKIKLQISNGFFCENQKMYSNISQEYNTFIKKIGRIYPVNISNASDTINIWINDVTRGLIPKIVSQNDIRPNFKMMIINVIYFKADWNSRFDESYTKNHDFQKSSGFKIKVPLMYQQNEFRYAEDSKFQFITLPYQNPNFVMDIILPAKSNNNFPVQNLAQFIDIYTNNQCNTDVKLYLPKFKQTSTVKLTKILNKTGINQLFVPFQSDLGNITNVKEFYISDIIQKTMIEVNETGTIAVSATSLNIYMNSARTELSKAIFKADRTFQYTIRYIPTNTIIFTGIYDGN